MGLFNKLFRSYDFESMDEVKQIELIDGLGISDLREDTESIKERMGLLEQNLDKLESSLHWRDNIITGDVALARVKEKEEELSCWDMYVQAQSSESVSVGLRKLNSWTTPAMSGRSGGRRMSKPKRWK